MQSFLSSRPLLLPEFLLAALTACQSMSPVVRVSDLQREPPTFRAAYRLQCCGLRGLVLVVQHGGEGLSLEIAGGPGGALQAVWISRGEVLERTRNQCLARLPEDSLPLPGGAVLPTTLVPLLGGLLPPGGREEQPGFWVGEANGATLKLQLAGNPARWVKGWWVREGVEYRLWASQHHGRLPGKLVLRGPHLDLQLVLLEFRPSSFVPPPPWVRWPRCPEVS